MEIDESDLNSTVVKIFEKMMGLIKDKKIESENAYLKVKTIVERRCLFLLLVGTDELKEKT